jgi:ribosomal protein L24
MGIWPIIVKIGTAVGGLVVKGVKAVKKKKAEEAAASSAKLTEIVNAAVAKKKAQLAAVAEEKKIQAEKVEARASQNKTMLTMMLPVAAIAALMLLKK